LQSLRGISVVLSTKETTVARVDLLAPFVGTDVYPYVFSPNESRRRQGKSLGKEAASVLVLYRPTPKYTNQYYQQKFLYYINHVYSTPSAVFYSWYYRILEYSTVVNMDSKMAFRQSCSSSKDLPDANVVFVVK
jgi:hypothetical protein